MMGFWEHESTFFSKDIIEFNTDSSLSDPGKNAPRISVDYDEADGAAIEKLTRILEDPLADQLEALVIGPWGSEMFETPPDDLLESLIAAAPQLASLKALFWGDVVSEECEISWINQTDLSPLMGAFPKLEHLRIRGSGGLSLGNINHDLLDTLIIESGGLGAEIVDQIAKSQLPSLSHLEVYFGDSSYGGNATIKNAKPLMSVNQFPKLTHLGLRNADFSDDIAAAIVDSDILPQLKVLDLSLGTLSDTGAKALLAAGNKLEHLESLDLHHHYLSNETVEKLNALNIPVNTEDGQGATSDDDRYVSVGE